MSTEIWLILVVSIVVALYGLVRYAARPYTWRVAAPDLLPYLERLLKRGYGGSFMVIEEPDGPRFVQFAKYIKGGGNIGVELSFPRAAWSEPYFDEFEQYLLTSEIAFKRQAVQTPPTIEFLDVDFGRDTAKAHEVAKAILAVVFKIPISTQLKVRFSNLSLNDELIDR